MKKLFTLLTALVMGVAVYAQRTMVYSTASDGYVNIRSTNSMNGRIIGEMYTGGAGAVYMHTSGNWYKVNYNGIVGYVHKSAVRLYKSNSYQTQVSRRVVAAAYDGYVNIRRGPSAKSSIIGEMINGDGSATYLGQSGNWYKVNFRGTVGYVHKDHTVLR